MVFWQCISKSYLETKFSSFFTMSVELRTYTAWPFSLMSSQWCSIISILTSSHPSHSCLPLPVFLIPVCWTGRSLIVGFCFVQVARIARLLTSCFHTDLELQIPANHSENAFYSFFNWSCGDGTYVAWSHQKKIRRFIPYCLNGELWRQMLLCQFLNYNWVGAIPLP